MSIFYCGYPRPNIPTPISLPYRRSPLPYLKTSESNTTNVTSYSLLSRRHESAFAYDIGIVHPVPGLCFSVWILFRRGRNAIQGTYHGPRLDSIPANTLRSYHRWPYLLRVTPSRNPIPTTRSTMPHHSSPNYSSLLAEDRALKISCKRMRKAINGAIRDLSPARPSFLAKFAALGDPDSSPSGISGTSELAPAIILSSQDQYGPVRTRGPRPRESGAVPRPLVPELFADSWARPVQSSPVRR
jgi:hypothetical protein